MSQKIGIVWFRQDLRLHDNEALTEALQHCDTIIPIYVFDRRVFHGKTRQFGFPKTGKFRAKFILESIVGLRQSLRKMGSELVVRLGKPEGEVFKIAQHFKTSWVFCNRERTQEELMVQDNLEHRLWTIGQEMRYSRGKMLYYTSDLPFPINQTPEVFTQFRKEVERAVQVRSPLLLPNTIPAFEFDLDIGTMPSLQELGYQPFKADERAPIVFQGGETAGLERLNNYLWTSGAAKSYFDTRNEMLGADYSTKFSAWLAQGCISPKKIFHELKAFEQQHGENKSTYSIFFELMWRDFFRLIAKKHGNKIYMKGGLREEPNQCLRNDNQLFQTWVDGETGVPFVDANMREPKLTGFMSNRGRQNVASYLINDMKLNWQMGAEYFESQLIDYDTASNWGNWNYLAGVGNGPREERYFNIENQAKQYDPQGDYVRYWA
ncbi:MAG: DASH family cryptochrome [Saprospiraceae bacterium]|nr:DASH family cryptochrome [Saprospiraceae bacterium]MCF8248476.1 DASH family cryptochrome [Saprospiraceae bacterium]MCF8281808.1 DASH family cryptochrome [Bacteroidales bacterium]MCF8310210.1 DASH family cryptochrome [Saprospiraceae bacterium]MCF8439351.1 DASH family cryptochrome [Saprospiraceae bacterium]